MTSEIDAAAANPDRVDEFLAEYLRLTGHIRTQSRKNKLDRIIRRHERAGLGLEEKVAAFRRLSPRGAFTGPQKELRLQRLLLSVAAADLPRFKFALDYDGDYKDLEEYVYHDVDDEDLRAEILAHLNAGADRRPSLGTKVLTDVDDTLYANLVDRRYPKETFYPGVLELYRAIAREPFAIAAGTVPVTTLSARPNPVAGKLEEGSIAGLIERTGGRLRPSALSGRVVSSAVGTLETLTREKRAEVEAEFSRWLAGVLPAASERLGAPPHPDALEQEIGRVKFSNFRRFASVYPEYQYVFFGDSGQADALTADLMVRDQDDEFGARVAATFIHDLRERDDDAAGSPSFRRVLIEQRTAEERRAPIFLFRNHIDAAVQAHRHANALVPAAALAEITKVALTEFWTIVFRGLGASRTRLAAQLTADARAALALIRSQPGLAAAAAEVEALLEAR